MEIKLSAHTSENTCKFYPGQYKNLRRTNQRLVLHLFSKFYSERFHHETPSSKFKYPANNQAFRVRPDQRLKNNSSSKISKPTSKTSFFFPLRNLDYALIKLVNSSLTTTLSNSTIQIPLKQFSPHNQI